MMQVNAHKASQRGVGLIEVMIAIVVVSIGILAILGMQITSKQANYDAVQRTTAAHLAHDIIERMRANPDALATYTAAGVIGAGGISSQTCTSASLCSTANMAGLDLYQFEQAMIGAAETKVEGSDTLNTGGLVSPRACIVDAGGGGNSGMYEIVIVWRGTGEQTATALGAICSGGLDSTGLYGTGDRTRRLLRVPFYVSA